ncbi:MAG TPA: hypothetical protein VMD76_07445 [Candidatus Sulfotelmatobacter sp.]|nr:hypothetical protein [Candidatus Sulfotelmatobacter sp.]
MKDMSSPGTLEHVADGQAGPMTEDDGRLRYVTRLLGGQPGLNLALFGTFLFLINVQGVLNGPSGWWILLEALASIVVLKIYLAAYKRWIPNYYRQRFGHVEASSISAKQFGILLSVLVALLFVGWPAAHYLDPTVSRFDIRIHQAISDPERQINLMPSFYWAVLFVISLRRNASSLEIRRSFFLLGGLLGFASIALLPTWHPELGGVRLWQILNTGGLGLSFIVLGLYDHITLIRLLPRSIAEGDDE